MKEIILKGKFKAGWALDYQTLYSIPIDPEHKLFDTKRTEIGQLLYELKYTGIDLEEKKKRVEVLAKKVVEFLKSRYIYTYDKIDVILPVPHLKKGNSNQL